MISRRADASGAAANASPTNPVGPPRNAQQSATSQQRTRSRVLLLERIRSSENGQESRSKRDACLTEVNDRPSVAHQTSPNGRGGHDFGSCAASPYAIAGSWSVRSGSPSDCFLQRRIELEHAQVCLLLVGCRNPRLLSGGRLRPGGEDVPGMHTCTERTRHQRREG